MNLSGFTITNHVYIPERVKPDTLFEKKYNDIRWLEKRMYSDEEVLHLPDISTQHPHFREWLIRKGSCRKLIHYLQQKQSTLKILEAGCGNGWLSFQLSHSVTSEVIGSDINFTELQQAARVYRNIPGLEFIYGDIRSGVLDHMKFDIILFAASVQYFPSLREIINIALQLLNPGGELHIMDSPFYKKNESAAAKKRTESYYRQMGFPEMARQYFHHTFEELDLFSNSILYKPHPFAGIIFRNSNPFTWVCIKKDDN